MQNLAWTGLWLDELLAFALARPMHSFKWLAHVANSNAKASETVLYDKNKIVK